MISLIKRLLSKTARDKYNHEVMETGKAHESFVNEDGETEIRQVGE